MTNPSFSTKSFAIKVTLLVTKLILLLVRETEVQYQQHNTFPVRDTEHTTYDKNVYMNMLHVMGI